jgi:ABC-2 type transport system permease protein
VSARASHVKSAAEQLPDGWAAGRRGRRLRGEALAAIMTREGKIRATNLTFIFWDLFYPLGYLLVFGVGINASLGFGGDSMSVSYNAFFLAGVLAMASFGIASNTSWSFFLDRDNGIFYEMLTYPMSRAQYLLGKVLFNVLVGVLQTAITVLLAAALLGVPLRPAQWPLLATAMIVGTAGWFFFYAIFALRIRRNDAFNAVNSIFYFVFLFASSMFYPLDPLPPAFRAVAYANPITWHVDVVRYATIGVGDPARVALEAAAFVLFTGAAFAAAVHALRNQE